MISISMMSLLDDIGQNVLNTRKFVTNHAFEGIIKTYAMTIFTKLRSRIFRMVDFLMLKMHFQSNLALRFRFFVIFKKSEYVLEK